MSRSGREEDGGFVSTETRAGTRRRFFVSYRHVDPDERLAHYLQDELTKAGHEVFIDTRMLVGTAWAKRIAERIQWCEFLVILLSEESVASEMVREEVRLAHALRGQDGHPFVLPIRVRYDGDLVYPLKEQIGSLHYA